MRIRSGDMNHSSVSCEFASIRMFLRVNLAQALIEPWDEVAGQSGGAC